MNTAVTRATFHPVALDGATGRLFAVWYPPAAARPSRGFDLVCLPPFAEELNRSRRMIALQARSFAAAGIGVLVFDLHGTGDSAGDFCDGRLDIWRADAGAAVRWLAGETGRPVGLWGIRFGGLLATALVAAGPTLFPRLVLWNPIGNGQTMVNQVLRIRIAAEMGRAGAGAGTGAGAGVVDTRALRQEFAAGRAVEVAGYALHPDLVAALDGLRLAEPPPPPGLAVDWLELVAEPGRPLPPAAATITDAWRRAGCRVAVHTPAGPPFWSLPDTTLNPAMDLIAATTVALIR